MTRSIIVPIYAEVNWDLHRIGEIEFNDGDDVEAFVEKLRPVLAALHA